MTVLNKIECDKVTEIEEYILTHYQVTVADVKKKFNLTSEEYDMIMDLIMPALRYFNRAKHLEAGIRRLIRVYSGETEEPDAECIDNEELRAS